MKTESLYESSKLSVKKELRLHPQLQWRSTLENDFYIFEPILVLLFFFFRNTVIFIVQNVKEYIGVATLF